MDFFNLLCCMSFWSWLMGDDDEEKQTQKDIDDTMEIAFDPKESAEYDEWDEVGMVPHSQFGDDDDDSPKTPPWDDPPDDSGGGFWGWLMGRR